MLASSTCRNSMSTFIDVDQRNNERRQEIEKKDKLRHELDAQLADRKERGRLADEQRKQEQQDMRMYVSLLIWPIF